MAKNEKTKRMIGWLAAMVLTAGFIIYLGKEYALLLISPDDVAMKNIISGAFTGTPDGHSVFMRYPLSWLLSMLYRVYNAISWYELFFLGCHVWCVWLILVRCSRMTGKKMAGYLLCAMTAVVFLFTKNIVNLEWTTTAGVLGMTAIYRYGTMPQCQNWKQAVPEYGVCIVLLALGFCLRHTAVLMLVPIAFVCWLKKMLEARKKAQWVRKRIWVSETAFLATAGILVLAVMVVHSVAYGSEEWRDYHDYTEDRSALFDYYGYPDYWTYQEEYEKAGISYQVYDLMTSDYNYVVAADHFDEIDLHSMALLAEDLYGQQTLSERLKDCARSLKNVVRDKDVQWTLGVLAALALGHVFVVGKKEKSLWFSAIGAVVCTVGVGGFLLFRGRFPVRVALCLLYGMAAVLAGNVFEGALAAKKEPARCAVIKWLAAGVACVAVWGLLTMQQAEIRQTNDAQAPKAQARNQLAQYCNQNPENIYFYDFWSFAQRGDYFMKAVDSTNYVRAGGWLYHTPVYEQMQMAFDCYDLVEAIKTRENVYYLVSESRMEGVMQRLNDYFYVIGETIGMEVSDVFETSAENVAVLRFRHVLSNQ